MNISWGVRIAILYGGFVLLIATLVYKSMNQKFDLVSPDYYAEELAFQDVIDAGKNQAGLSAAVNVEQAGGNLLFIFPPEFERSGVKGTIVFYAPVNAGWDRKIAMESEDRLFPVPLSGFEKTVYRVRISWAAAGRQYFQETELNLN